MKPIYVIFCFLLTFEAFADNGKVAREFTQVFFSHRNVNGGNVSAASGHRIPKTVIRAESFSEKSGRLRDNFCRMRLPGLLDYLEAVSNSQRTSSKLNSNQE